MPPSYLLASVPEIYSRHSSSLLRLKAFKETRPKEYMAWKAAGAIYSPFPAMIALPSTMYPWLA